MRIRQLVTIILLMSMSFSMLHAFAIDLLDDDHCSVSEFVHEIDQMSGHDLSGDVCDMHYAFHIPFVLPETTQVTLQHQCLQTQFGPAKTYSFQLLNRILQPPKTLS